MRTLTYPNAMLARMILALLLAAFALPAAAAMPCHDAPMAMSAMAHHGATPHDKAMPAHACIGCVPPSSWRATVFSVRLRQQRPTLASRIARLDLGEASPPATPPPKPEA